MTKADVKENGKQLSNDTKTVIKNFVRLVESAALLTVSVYAGLAAHEHNFEGFGFKLLTLAAVLIGLRGAEQFLKHLANK